MTRRMMAGIFSSCAMSSSMEHHNSSALDPGRTNNLLKAHI